MKTHYIPIYIGGGSGNRGDRGSANIGDAGTAGIRPVGSDIGTEESDIDGGSAI